MKLRKPLSLLLSAVMVTGMASFGAGAASTNDDSVGAGSYYNASYLEDYAKKAYDEQGLGSTYSKSSTTWKTWSPEAASVKLKLYKTGTDSEAGAGVIGTYDLSKNSATGVWSLTLDGDYKDVYYTYLVNVNGQTNETQDVYSKAVGAGGNRSMVVDLDSTDPDGWNNDGHVLFDNASQAAVWEIHVRDFSASDTSGVSAENQGKYLAFAEGGTKLNSDSSADSVSTGIDYLVEEGINCVQLMPVYDFQSVDETSPSSSSNRNWGYDPQNYNVPEGSYSSDAYNGNTRITEFKQMIQALHDRNISVVMDVVYNHTYTTDGSCFSRTVPGYYYRKTSASVYSNGSGCGNETASDKLMYRKYMIESVKYWAEEYHIDGFRFDLMGIHDVTTMNSIRSAVDSMYADGSGKKILMYGEPWTGGTVAISNGCTQGRSASLDARVGMFCDSYRDAIKGDTNGSGKGFIQGTTSKTATVVNGVKGKGFNAQAPSQTIAYADAHDNLILWDKIVKSNGSSSWTSTSESFRGQMKGVMALLLTSQGIPFMTAGSEFCRTKKGDHNSYKSSDDINAIDWSRVSTYADTAAYYKGLLEIREHYSPMAGSTFNTPTFQSRSGNVVAYTYSNNKSNEWGKVCVLVNSGTQAYAIDLDGSGWTVVADGNNAGLKSLGTVSGSSYSVPAHGSAVLVESSTFNNLKNTETKYGSLTINHVDESGKLLKTSESKYREGSTYRALPDSTLLFDRALVSTSGETSGKVTADGKYTVTFTYSSDVVPSGYLTVKYVDESGKALKDEVKYHLRQGESYDIPFEPIQGCQLDTDNYPAKTSGTFNGSDMNATFVYKDLDSTSSVVHYYNANNWKKLRCYAYTSDGKEPNGAWASATLMTDDGNGWFSCTVPASSAYVMFHPSSGSGQEPGQGETGYLVSGEAWIQNKTVTFSSKIITSHIDIATGKKVAQDVVDSQEKTTSDKAYTTSAVTGFGEAKIPANAQGNYSAGVVNVVYLYNSDVVPTTPTTVTPPETTVTPPETTVTPPETTATQPTTTVPQKRILIGDINHDRMVSVIDGTLIQRHIVESEMLTGDKLIAADCDGDGDITIKDVTLILKCVVESPDCGNAGKYIYIDDPNPSEAPTTAPETQITEPQTTEFVPETTVQVPETTEFVPETTVRVPETTKPEEPDTYTVKFSNSQRWTGTIYCYYWEDGSEGVWPGIAMDFLETNDFGEDVYTVEVPSSADYVIFNNNDSQTVDIPFDGTELGFYATSDLDELWHHGYGTW